MIQRQRKREPKFPVLFCVASKSILALTGGFVLFLALFAGPFMMLAFTNLGLWLAFTNLGLWLAVMNLGHCYPSPSLIHTLPAADYTEVRQNISLSYGVL